MVCFLLQFKAAGHFLTFRQQNAVKSLLPFPTKCLSLLASFYSSSQRTKLIKHADYSIHGLINWTINCLPVTTKCHIFVCCPILNHLKQTRRRKGTPAGKCLPFAASQLAALGLPLCHAVPPFVPGISIVRPWSQQGRSCLSDSGRILGLILIPLLQQRLYLCKAESSKGSVMQLALGHAAPRPSSAAVGSVTQPCNTKACDTAMHPHAIINH